MGLFTRNSKTDSSSCQKDGKQPIVFGQLTGVAHPYKKLEKNELNRNAIVKRLENLNRFPSRVLEESAKILKELNRTIIKAEQRDELSDLLASYVYPIVSMWYEKYQLQENSLPESNERRNAMIASIEAVNQLCIHYLNLFEEFYSLQPDKFKRYRTQLYEYAFRALELIRVEQCLRALRYQKLSKAAWQHSNQLFFLMLQHNNVDENHNLIGLIGTRRKSNKLRQSGTPSSSIRKLYLSIQLFGMLDVTTWPTRLFNVPDHYLSSVENGLYIAADDDKELPPGWLITYYANQGSPLFQRFENLPKPALRINYVNLYNTLVKDHQELGKQQFLAESNLEKISKPLHEVHEADRVPVLELMIMGLTRRERKQKRHSNFDTRGLSVYFGYSEVSRLLKDLSNPDKFRVKESRLLVDTLAQQSALLAEDDKHHMSLPWTITNFSAGGLLIGTEETDFSNPIQIDQLVAFTMPDNPEQPILGFVRRLNRPESKRVEVAVVRLTNYAESAGVQNQDELDSHLAKGVILTRDIRNQWNLIIKTSMPYQSGQPLKLVRANGNSIPVRLGEVLYTKKDFKIFEVRSPGLEMKPAATAKR